MYGIDWLFLTLLLGLYLYSDLRVTTVYNQDPILNKTGLLHKANSNKYGKQPPIYPSIYFDHDKTRLPSSASAYSLYPLRLLPHLSSSAVAIISIGNRLVLISNYRQVGNFLHPSHYHRHHRSSVIFLLTQQRIFLSAD